MEIMQQAMEDRGHKKADGSRQNEIGKKSIAPVEYPFTIR
jgi:hypothetical protein